MDEFAVDPPRRAGIGKVPAFDPPFADRRLCDALIKAGQLGRCPSVAAETPDARLMHD